MINKSIQNHDGCIKTRCLQANSLTIALLKLCLLETSLQHRVTNEELRL